MQLWQTSGEAERGSTASALLCSALLSLERNTTETPAQWLHTITISTWSPNEVRWQYLIDYAFI
jgi:hypothetical protein